MHMHTLWAARVAAETVLPDKRLRTRLACILEAFAERPSDAIPQAAGSWGQAKGIYRFLANQRRGDLSRVEFKPHREKSNHDDKNG